MNWIVTLKVIGPFDRDVKLDCYKLKYIKGKGIVVSGSSVPFYVEYDGEDIFIPVKDIYKIETEVWSEWGTKRETVCFDNTWKDEEDRMLDRMDKRRGLLYYIPIPQNGSRNKLGNAEIKRRFKVKAGHWELLYPGIEDINKLSIKADVKCLDCGKEQHVGLNQWLSPKNLTNGCPYCGQKKPEDK